MAKRKTVRPVQKIELEFEDGTIKEILFSAAAVAIIDEEFEGTLKLATQMHTKPYEAGAKIIYAGMKVCDENITFEEVKSLTLQMPFDIIMELIEEFMDNLNVRSKNDSEEVQEFKQNFMKEILQLK